MNFCIAQSQNGIDHEADYRALTADGRYVWIRDVVHVQRNAAGETEALIGFMFDISERKRAEEEVLELHKRLEMLSMTDGLTGVHNRRYFDHRSLIEFSQAVRHRYPLACLFLAVFGEAGFTYADHTADWLVRPDAYIRAVLGGGA